MSIIVVDHVTKEFRARRGARVLLGRGGIGDWIRGNRSGVFTALKDVSFTVEPGESLGLIGANGSGKSTLLKIIAGVTVPTRGHVTVNGRVASLLELGAGFHHMLTGRENVYLNAGLLGMRHAQVDQIFDDIVEFSGIGKFIDNPVDTYSSGMYVRIAFSVAAHVNPDVFLIDEVLSVGDEEFQRKCRRRIGEIREQGKTIIVVSHDLGIVNTLCDRAILLSRGEMISRGTPQRTIEYYLRQVGRESGIHTLKSGTVEALVSNGRVSLFVDERELTAPSAIQLQFIQMNQYHRSDEAEWTITERSATACVARGKMSRLPATLVWRLRFVDDVLHWEIELECEREAHTETMELNLTWPTTFTEWVYGHERGAFPGIGPEDQAWTVIVPPEAGERFVGLRAPEDEAMPSVTVSILEAMWDCRVQLFNTDYVQGTRLIQVYARVPSAALPLKPGTTKLLALEINLCCMPEAFEESVRQRLANRMITSGPLTAYFHKGAIVIRHSGRELTKGVHLHTECLLGNVWVFSQTFFWESVGINENVLEMTGVSRRFPLRQLWRLEAVDGGFMFSLEFETTELMACAEFNVSMGLIPEYTEWNTGIEQGDFPVPLSEATEWSHVNADYGASDSIAARGDALPTIMIRNADASLPTRMSAMVGSAADKMQVLQILRIPERMSAFHFNAGRHRAFVGEIRIGD